MITQTNSTYDECELLTYYNKKISDRIVEAFDRMKHFFANI